MSATRPPQAVLDRDHRELAVSVLHRAEGRPRSSRRASPRTRDTPPCRRYGSTHRAVPGRRCRSSWSTSSASVRVGRRGAYSLSASSVDSFRQKTRPALLRRIPGLAAPLHCAGHRLRRPWASPSARARRTLPGPDPRASAAPCRVESTAVAVPSRAASSVSSEASSVAVHESARAFAGGRPRHPGRFAGDTLPRLERLAALALHLLPSPRRQPGFPAPAASPCASAVGVRMSNRSAATPARQ